MAPGESRWSTADPAAVAVETSLFRALAVLRVVVLAFAVGTNATRWGDLDQAWLGWTVLAVMAGWTLVVTVVYEPPRGRRAPWLVADLTVALLALLSTPLVLSQPMLDSSDPTVPTFWVSAALLAWAVRWRWPGGLAAAGVLSAADLAVRNEVDSTAVGNIFLLFLVGGVVGYGVGLLRDAAVARGHAERLAAAAAERERLARDIHDGVLQVLALVQRRGAELGGPATELGRLAGEQEVALRNLVQRGPEPSPGLVDLRDPLERFGGTRVTVAAPGEPVWVPARTSDELAAAVRAALDNTTAHAGEHARAWVLVEQEPDAVVVSVRDDGRGIAGGRLEAASAEGRMGVSASIRGRLRDLGGEARLHTAPGTGVEWELRVPHRVPS